MQEQGQTLRRTGPYSREAAIARPRRRTRESRFLEKIRADLTAHVGGKPSAPQKLLIERIAMTLLRIELMDRDALNERDGAVTERQARDYLAWNNTVARMLRELGLDAVPPPPARVPTLKEILAEQAKQPWPPARPSPAPKDSPE